MWNCHAVEEWRVRKMRVWMDDYLLFEGELSSGHARERMPQTILFVNKFGLVENDGLQTDENRI